MSVIAPVAIGVALVVSVYGQFERNWQTYPAEQSEKSDDDSKDKGEKGEKDKADRGGANAHARKTAKSGKDPSHSAPRSAPPHRPMTEGHDGKP